MCKTQLEICSFWLIDHVRCGCVNDNGVNGMANVREGSTGKAEDKEGENESSNADKVEEGSEGAEWKGENGKCEDGNVDNETELVFIVEEFGFVRVSID